MNDLILDRDYRIGSNGPKVKLIQEWLNLYGFKVRIDGDFGPVTDNAVRQFQAVRKLKIDGLVGNNTFTELIRPMAKAMASIPIVRGITTLGSLIVAYAQLHLESHPREVGGQNRGPWVRLYMNGNEGTPWAWCAGFVFYVVAQACKTLDIPLPIPATFSCDVLAKEAQQEGLFVAESGGRVHVLPGSLFLVRKTDNDWTHVGIVTSVQPELFHTSEGNTNDEGHREGYEACARMRSYRNVDFVVWR